MDYNTQFCRIKGCGGAGYLGLSCINLNCKYTIFVFWELNDQKYTH